MERRGSEDSWRRLRLFRSDFLGVTEAGDLHSLFASALHQAEQQFRAARTVGYESRPLNLFYGLSQAGRAVAAVASLRGATPVELNGHGIKCTNLGDFRMGRVPHLANLKVRSEDSTRASFPVLSRILQSQELRTPTTLARLWEMLVEPQLHEPLTTPQAPVLLVEQESLLGPEGSGTGFLQLSGIPASIDFSDPANFTQFSLLYPSLVGTNFDRVTGQSRGYDSRPAAQSIQVLRTVPASLNGTISTYRGSPVALPSPPAGDRSMHPLMIWWAILYGLSMLARYEPTSWTKLIDVNASPSAVPIEFLLDIALESIVDILADTIGELLSEIPQTVIPGVE
jgi:hypothetical protein